MGCGSSTTSSCSNYALVSDNKRNYPIAPVYHNHHHHNHRQQKYPVYGPDSIMNRKRHGTSDVPVQTNLRWDIPHDMADKICNFNYGMAEHRGFAIANNGFNDELQTMKKLRTTIQFFDSNTGNLLFQAPIGRSYTEFEMNCKIMGWPTFTDEEVNWEYVRCLSNGVLVSVNGTHLGHNLPDQKGNNRYSVNLCSIAGRRVDRSNAQA